MSALEAVPTRFPLRLSLLLLLLLAAAPLPAQTPRFEDTSQVVAVEVPVNVVDRDGQPVRGLTAADFEVFDGGEPQKITGFEIIDLKTVQSEPAAASRPAENLPSGGRRHFLLLFDLSFSSPTSILKARLAARDLVLNALHASDLAAVATYSLETGPKLLVTFTPDRSQLARAIDTLGYRQAFDARKVDPLHFLIEPPSTATSGNGFSLSEGTDLRAQRDQAVREYLQTLAFAAEREERAFEIGRITSYSRSLGDMARLLNAVKGRKNVILFSEGFDSRLLVGRQTTDKEAEDDNFNAIAGQIWKVDSDQRYGNTGLQGDLKRMLDEFRRADCVIQAVDIGGLRASGDERSRPSGQEALFYIANETGGELFKDANNLRQPLERLLERTSVTYLLTFERSDLKLDGSFHRLKVKAKLPAGARLSYRNGYYAPRPFKDLDPLEKGLLASDSIASAAPKHDVDLNVLAAPFRAGEAQSYVPVILEIGGHSLLEGHTAKKLNVEIYSYVSDAQGQMRDFFSQRVALDIEKSRRAMEEGGIKYYGHFDLAPGAYQVRVLVRNADTGRTGVQTAAVEVPTYSPTDPVLLPPFFMEDRQKWLLVREQEGSGGLQQSVVYPFTVGGEPYVPAARPVLRREQPARLCLVAYNLGKGDLAVQGRVVAANGQASLAGKLSKVERTATGIQGLDKLVATFDPSGLNAGDYILQVAVTDPATGHKEASSLPFHVLH
ncbi:MAG TPA: VWA domain-containing protein [Thermoanaerobaculia bacterium]|jgi:VWFA-related protein|nr:VWA domain-containing protein [Thermoanaerobaculia bacterium]